MCINDLTNTIDFSLYNGLPISGSGYIPDDGIIINDLEQYEEIINIPISEININMNKETILKQLNFDILFAQKSNKYIFNKEYLEFIKFCLLMMLRMDVDTIEKLMTDLTEIDI